MSDSSFFSELRKRKVVQAAAIYGAVAWGVTEVLVTIVDQLFLPQWVSTLAVIFFVVGFPIAMFLSWTFDITTEGIRRTTVSSRKGTASIAASLVLLVAGTTGLFLLIKPSLEVRENGQEALVGLAPNSIAVLPFANAGVREQDAYLVSGLSDELRDQLARVSDLRIAARSSSVAAMDQGLDAMAASRKLGVAHLVEGNIRQQGNLLKVSVQLIDSSSGLAQWSRTFERGPGEILTIQQAIAEAVVAEVLPGAEIATPEPATRDATANELMLLARHYDQRVRERQDINESVLLEAIRLYRQASEVDPDSALAHGRLARSLLFIGDIEAAAAPIFRALSLAPESSEVQTILGEYYWARGLTQEAGAAWTLAVELSPNNSEALKNFAWWNWTRIQADRAKALYERALEFDRLNLVRYAELGAFLALNDHTVEARELINVVETLFEGPAAYGVLADLYAYLGDVDISIAWTLKAFEQEPGNSNHLSKLAEFYADLNDIETALRLDPDGIGILFKARRYEEMIDLAEMVMIDEPQNLRIRALLAMAYNAQRKHEAALYVLKDTGLPGDLPENWRSFEELDGYYALINALYGSGSTDLAEELARRSIAFGHTESADWWITLRAACEHAVLHEDERAREYFERSRRSMHLPWNPVLKDSKCFERLKNDPSYRAMVQHYDDRRVLLLERLPATLAEFGVSL